ncbi:hypothetical protein FFWV33_07080 [Flavobacterium faecale]|uniref:Uncharacterized protein n=1 Tax=Flavobacterium faecale TaxID=1355330 RepID=A0A2S1LC26_9FLAO|nr:hypothetical protein FFWV33_07080 [Flavobacterium faecale]
MIFREGLSRSVERKSFFGAFSAQKRLQRKARAEVFTEGHAKNMKTSIKIGSPFISKENLNFVKNKKTADVRIKIGHRPKMGKYS